MSLPPRYTEIRIEARAETLRSLTRQEIPRMRPAWWACHQERFAALCTFSPNGSDFHDREPASRMITRGQVIRTQISPDTRKDRT